jgi:threonine dehydrogenase-like Zn-dependent dehydrogenase
VQDLTDGRGVDSAIDAVGMEAHGSPVAAFSQRAAAFLPDAVAAPMIEKAGVDRLAALRSAIDIARRGGTVSISGVYGGAVDPLPMMTMFDKQLTLRMGQGNVRRWSDDLTALGHVPSDPLGVLDLRTHRVPLDDAPAAYEMFQKKHDGCIKVVLDPHA